MDFVTLEYDREYRGWVPEHLETFEACTKAMEEFNAAAELSKLRWEALDVMQKYCFKMVNHPNPLSPQVGLRFLGVEARWGEYVAATQDQLVLGNPL